MNRNKKWSGAVAWVCLLSLAAGCGGGDSGGDSAAKTFALTGVTPSVSPDLNGGDRVTLTGSNFLALVVAGRFGGQIMFGGAIGFSPTVVDDTTLAVTVPPAASGSPGVVSILVTVPGFADRALFGAFTYEGLAGPPRITAIVPTVFSATGAREFRIEGTNLGTPNGTAEVRFEGIGDVTANVSADARFVIGNAPISAGAPPAGDIQVILDNGGLAGPEPVPTRVTFEWFAPAVLPLPRQVSGGASLPVRVSEGFAVLCTGGVDNVWGSADDEIILATGSPGNPHGFSTQPLRANVGIPVGHLDTALSVPAVLDGNTVCVYSVGPDRTRRTADDRLILVTTLQGAPVTTILPLGFLPNSTAPVAVSPTHVALTSIGPDGTAQTPDDQLAIGMVNGTNIAFTLSGAIGALDATATVAARSFSTPIVTDTGTVWVTSMGPNATPNDGDDGLIRFKVNEIGQGTFVSGAARYLQQAPTALSLDLLAAPAAGADNVLGTPDDVLAVFRLNAGQISRADRLLGDRLGIGSLTPLARLGNTGVIVPLVGIDGNFNTDDDLVGIFTEPNFGPLIEIDMTSAPLCVTLRRDPVLGTRDALIIDRGGDGVSGTGDEFALVVDSNASDPRPIQGALPWRQNYVPRTDETRMFTVGLGPDMLNGTGDEQLLVFQTRAIGQLTEVSPMPMAAFMSPVLDGMPFVPVASNWGLMQSPGPDGAFNTPDDRLIFVTY